jgi:magnesium-transporting ATPase (P-type)
VLYVNLITAVTLGMMLAAEPPEATVMDKSPRRPGKRLLGKVVIWRVLFVCTVMVIIVECFFWWGDTLGLPLCERRAEAFNALVFMEIGYAWACRYVKEPSFQIKAFKENMWCYPSIVITVALQCLLTYTPGLNKFFSMCGMGGLAWARVLVAMVVVYIIVEVEKALVDPLLMPMMRPVLKTVKKFTPKFLQVKTLEDAREEQRKHDHPEHHHSYSMHSMTNQAVGIRGVPQNAANGTH